METGPICQKSCISAETVVRTLYTTVPAPCAWHSSRPLRGVDRRVRSSGDEGYLDVSSDEMSQTFTVLSLLPQTIRFPSGLKLTL